MGPMIEDNITPVFLINGFLEAGKTEFLTFTMEQDYFQTEGKTLLIACEEGENEFEEDLLRDTNTTMITVDTAMKAMTNQLLFFLIKGWRVARKVTEV